MSADIERVCKAEGDPQPFLPKLETFVRSSCWDACHNVRQQNLPNIISELRMLNFCHLRLFDANVEGCKKLITWLLDLGPRNEGLIRLAPACETDYALLQRYDGPFVNYSPENNEAYYFISLHHGDGRPQSATDGRGGHTVYRTTGMFWLGDDERSCLAVAYLKVVLIGLEELL